MLQIAFLLAGALGPAPHSPAIGVAIATGSFQVDGSRVFGNTSLFDGATIETGRASSRLQLSSGARMELAAQSRARVFARRLALERGVSELSHAAGYQIEARTLHIAPVDAAAVARVRLEGGNTVLVAAVNGPVRVTNRVGLLVATLAPGAALSFQPQAGQPESFQMTGCLLQKEGKFILVDETSHQIVELRGTGLGDQIGNRIRIVGTAFREAQPVAGASQVVQVNAMERVSTGGCAAAAASTGASTQPPAPAVTKGGSHKAAIIAGVAVGGGAAVGAAVALSGGKKTSTSP